MNLCNIRIRRHYTLSLGKFLKFYSASILEFYNDIFPSFSAKANKCSQNNPLFSSLWANSSCEMTFTH